MWHTAGIQFQSRTFDISDYQIVIYNTTILQAHVYLIGKNFIGKRVRRQKCFVGRNFRHLVKISSLSADEIFYPTFFLKFLNFRFSPWGDINVSRFISH